MPRLLRDVLYVIETFHKYAREDGDEVILTCRELKRLIQDQFGDILQPCATHAVERNLNLLAIDSDGTISFNEFVLTIFNLLNLHYLDIKSLLNPEPRQVSKPEEKPDNMDLQATSKAGHWTEGTPPTQDKVMLHSEIVSSAQLSTKEKGQNKLDPQGDTKTHKLPGEASGHNDPKNHHLEGDEQSQEVTPGVPATGDKEAQIETNKPTEGSEQTSSHTKGEEGQDKEIPREEDKPAREQSGTKTRDQIGEQEGNLGTQNSASEETTQTLPADQEVAAQKGVKEHFNTQEQPLQGKNKLSLELIDLPEQTAAQTPFEMQESNDPKHDGRTAETQEPGNNADRTPPETKNSAEPEDDGRAHETQEPPAQKKEYKLNNLPVQGDSRNVSEIPDVRTEEKEWRGPKARETVVQGESERNTQPPALEDEAQDRKYQKLQESSKERDAVEGSKIQELSSEEDQNHPETEGAATPGEEVRHAEEGRAETLVSNKNDSAAEGAAGATERIWELSPLENQTGGESKKVTKTHDKPVKEEEDDQGESPEPTVTQNDKRSSESPNSLTPQEGDSSSGTSDLFLQEDSQSQVDSLRESVQGSHNNNPDTQKQVALGEKNRTREAVGGENEQLTEEWEQPEGEGHKIQQLTKGPGPAVEPKGHPEAPALLETEKLVTVEEEDKSPQQLTREVDDQQNPAKKRHDSSILQAGLEERTQWNQEPCSAETGTVYSSPLYKYLQEKILQQTDMPKEEHQNQAQTSRVSGPELCDDQFSKEISDCPVFFSNSKALQRYTRELLPGKNSSDAQQTSALQALEDK
ncbi:trichohyalin-like protein 1 [Pteronotus mesoamericanus]|uniref:trichohyalin-like protein 1 n=1 Tax=Pteronotus mesoamericanus TaxID=1884717 RepID=UPI0023EB473A|nr:trichohyalin-like protein 1 [Pteronotus parnellii mesoamericanus]